MLPELEWALLQLVLRQSDEGIHLVDANGITRFYNESAAKMDGLDSGDVLDRHVLNVFPSLSRDTSTLLKVLRLGRPIFSQHQTYTNIRGAEVSTINTTLPVFGRKGERLGAVEIARDITRIQQLSEQIVQLQRRLHPGEHKREGLNAQYSFSDIVGESPLLGEVLNRAARAARTTSPVLVTGETGVGKEMLVQAIHNHGPRRGKPLVAQNCAALPESLLESILFGSVRGSFTGAADRPGLFELAGGGTLFLDELNAMPLSLQSKLLRVLENGELRRLGDIKTRWVDVRIIAAMGADPNQAIAQGNLRRDLFYRLNVVRLDLPPLRKRQEDLPLLAARLLGRLNTKLGTGVKQVEPQALQMLQDYHWPGNVRELSNLLERILNYRAQGTITPDDLPDYMRTCPRGGSLRRELNIKEQEMIRQAMSLADGNITAAAALLDIPRQTLQRKLRKHSLA